MVDKNQPATQPPVVAEPESETVADATPDVAAPQVAPAEPEDVEPESPEARPQSAPVPADITRVLEKNKATNRENAALRQRLKDQEMRLNRYDAEVAARKKKELGELEATKQELADKASKLSAMETDMERMRREAVCVRDFRVVPDYAGYVAAEMAKAGSDIDVVEWMDLYRTKHPAFFVPELVPQPAAVVKPNNGGVQTSKPETMPKPKPAESGGGGPSPVTAQAKETEIAQLKVDYQELSKPPKMYEDDAGTRRVKIKTRLKELSS